MQVAGRIGRIDSEPGDRVTKGQVLAEFDLVDFNNAIRDAEANIDRLRAALRVLDDNTLELTSLSEAEAVAQSAEESVRGAGARVKAAQARVDYTQKEVARNLAADRTVSDAALDAARYEADTAVEDLSRANSDLESQRAMLKANRLAPKRIRQTIERKKIERVENLAQLAGAQALLERVRHELELARVISPIDGIVLERYERGERPLPLGQELLLLGNPGEIELEAEVMTEDALKLAPGGKVLLESLFGSLKLNGRVKRIEPQGFTKLSSLGVEQQRVLVIVEIEDPPENLRVGFRLHARFFTGYKTDAIILPRFAVLQAPDQTYYVYAVEDGRLTRREVKLGLRSDLEHEIAEGLDEDSLVVTNPDSTMSEGTAVKPVKK
ncbi:MAG: efflux RND transporter periplasmic adaptor subunit [Myxococcota bacterium]